MNITITGASGFLGSRLISRLEQAGHRVVKLGRSRGSDFIWDAMQGPPPEESLTGSDALVHLAGEPVAQRWNEGVKRRIRESRTLGTRNLVEGLRKARRRPSVMLAASAVGFYGDRGDETLTESSPPGSGYLADVCREWESASREAEQLGLRVSIVRIGIVLAKNGGALKTMLLPFRLGVGGRIGDGRQWMPWIHADDLVNLMADALATDRFAGVLNGSAPAPVRNSEFTAELGRALRRPALLPVPMFGLRLLYGELADSMLHSQKVLPERPLASGFRFQYPELPGALREILGGS